MAKRERPYPEVDELRSLALAAVNALARLSSRASEIELTAEPPTKGAALEAGDAARGAQEQLQGWLQASVAPPFVRKAGRREGGA